MSTLTSLKQQLEIGNVLLKANSQGALSARYTVVRVTARFAFITPENNAAAELKIERHALHGVVHEIGSRSFFMIATPEVEARLKREAMIQECRSVQFEECSEAQLLALLKVVNATPEQLQAFLNA